MEIANLQFVAYVVLGMAVALSAVKLWLRS